jgi:chromosome segregation ATPase
MKTAGGAELRERATRWLEDGQSQLNMVLGILNDYDRLQGVADAAERECERLRSVSYENERLRNSLETAERECQALRAEVTRLRQETDRHTRDREELANSLTQVMNEILVRIRGRQD